MTRHASAAKDLAALLAASSPDVAAGNAATLAALQDETRPRRPTPLEACWHPSAPIPAPTEHEEQVALFAWAAANEGQWPELVMLAAIPNGGYRPLATAAMLKAEGVKAGYPDILLDVARRQFHGLRIELKRSDHSNHATPAQLEWLDRLRRYGYMAVVCYGAQEAIDVITAYLAQGKGG